MCIVCEGCVCVCIVCEGCVCVCVDLQAVTVLFTVQQ